MVTCTDEEEEPSEEEQIEMLRASHKLQETDDENVTLLPGITHLLIHRPSQKSELRKVR